MSAPPHPGYAIARICAPRRRRARLRAMRRSGYRDCRRRGSMEIAEQHTGKITMFEIKGRIDSNTAKVFAERLTSVINAGHARLVVDLKHIIYISSVGFRVLLMAGELVKGINGTVVLCSLSADVRKLFDIGAF